VISKRKRRSVFKNRTAAKIDKCQPKIVEDLRKIPGVTVETSKDDILVGYQKKTYWFELKDPEYVGKNGEVWPSKITPDEQRLADTWTGHYEIVWSLEQILKEIGL
jgi:hypothetical protein